MANPSTRTPTSATEALARQTIAFWTATTEAGLLASIALVDTYAGLAKTSLAAHQTTAKQFSNLLAESAQAPQ